MARRLRMYGTASTDDGRRGGRHVAHDLRQLDESAARATLRAYLGLVGGAALVHLLLNEYGAGLPRWARFLLIVAGSAGACCVLASLADSVRALAGRFVVIALVLLAAALIWSVA